MSSLFLKKFLTSLGDGDSQSVNLSSAIWFKDAASTAAGDDGTSELACKYTMPAYRPIIRESKYTRRLGGRSTAAGADGNDELEFNE